MPRLLDAFCGPGGASVGYARAGYDVEGVDHEPMVENPYWCYWADAVAFIREHGAEYDLIHASPPCQKYSAMTRRWPDREYPDLIGPTREALRSTGRPYVIENVVGAPLRRDILLCGIMFGLKVYRHRILELSDDLFILKPPHPRHPMKMPRSANSPKRIAELGGWMTVAGNVDRKAASLAMGIDWVRHGKISECIPPAYTEWLGRAILPLLPQ